MPRRALRDRAGKIRERQRAVEGRLGEAVMIACQSASPWRDRRRIPWIIVAVSRSRGGTWLLGETAGDHMQPALDPARSSSKRVENCRHRRSPASS